MGMLRHLILAAGILTTLTLIACNGQNETVPDEPERDQTESQPSPVVPTSAITPAPAETAVPDYDLEFQLVSYDFSAHARPSERQGWKMIEVTVAASNRTQDYIIVELLEDPECAPLGYGGYTYGVCLLTPSGNSYPAIPRVANSWHPRKDIPVPPGISVKIPLAVDVPEIVTADELEGAVLEVFSSGTGLGAGETYLTVPLEMSEVPVGSVTSAVLTLGKSYPVPKGGSITVLNASPSATAVAHFEWVFNNTSGYDVSYDAFLPRRGTLIDANGFSYEASLVHDCGGQTFYSNDYYGDMVMAPGFSVECSGDFPAYEDYDLVGIGPPQQPEFSGAFLILRIPAGQSGEDRELAAWQISQ